MIERNCEIGRDTATNEHFIPEGGDDDSERAHTANRNCASIIRGRHPRTISEPPVDVSVGPRLVNQAHRDNDVPVESRIEERFKFGMALAKLEADR